jgi:hypothetical protein
VLLSAVNRVTDDVTDGFAQNIFLCHAADLLI